MRAGPEQDSATRHLQAEQPSWASGSSPVKWARVVTLGSSENEQDLGHEGWHKKMSLKFRKASRAAVEHHDVRLPVVTPALSIYPRW